MGAQVVDHADLPTDRSGTPGHALDILRDLPNASHWEVVECGPGCDCGRATEAGQEALA